MTFNLSSKLISQLHVFFYVPLLAYAAYLGLSDKFVPDWVWYMFIGLAALATLMHGPKLMKGLKESMVIKEEATKQVN